MVTRKFWLAALAMGALCAQSAHAQISEDAKVQLLRTILADEAAAKIAFPLGLEGVFLSDSGQIDEQKLAQQMKKNGQAIEPGRVIKITQLNFSSDKIELQLDGGGKNKTSIMDHVSIGMGGINAPVTNDGRCAADPQLCPQGRRRATGSELTLKFAGKVPPDLTPDQLRKLLSPVLDFTKHTATLVESLPPEFQEAVKEKEARIGMDHDTVLLALGRPDNKSTEKNDQGIEEETWIYRKRGYHADFVVFVNNVVVRITQY